MAAPTVRRLQHFLDAISVAIGIYFDEIIEEQETKEVLVDL